MFVANDLDDANAMAWAARQEFIQAWERCKREPHSPEAWTEAADTLRRFHLDILRLQSTLNAYPWTRRWRTKANEDLASHMTLYKYACQSGYSIGE